MEYNAICPECEKLICADTTKEAIICPNCNAPIYVPRAVILFEDTYPTKSEEDYERPQTVAPPVRGERRITPVKAKVPKVGKYVKLGKYKQSGEGKGNIEWLVLEVKDGRALLISKYALDCKLYNTSLEAVTWESCTLREWLNNDFINTAFSAEEQAMIPTVTVAPGKNPQYGTNPGNPTQDKVFLLSIDEAEKYFKSSKARRCKPTAYVVAKGAFVGSSNGNCWWWLRSPGGYQDYSAGVDVVGGVGEYGNNVNDYDNAVRPALWIDLNS